jgi:hypothetical protein
MFADKPLASKDGVGSILERLKLVPTGYDAKDFPAVILSELARAYVW